MTANPYTDDWRAKIRAGVRSSAEALVPKFMEYLPDRPNVVDVGAGEGWFVREFLDHGANAIGTEAAWTRTHHGVTILTVDLEAGSYPKVTRRFDAAVCLEVAEHLSPNVGPYLVRWLTELAPVVFFSAAVPGQGGPGHVNERPLDYWAELFAEADYTCSRDLSEAVADDRRIEFWYRRNLLVLKERCHGEELEIDT